jgi:hypothetical protein
LEEGQSGRQNLSLTCPIGRAFRQLNEFAGPSRWAGAYPYNI